MPEQTFEFEHNTTVTRHLRVKANHLYQAREKASLPEVAVGDGVELLEEYTTVDVKFLSATSGMVFDGREIGTILAALRMYQVAGYIQKDLEEIATDNFTLKPLDYDEIKKLCEKVNCGG